MRTLRPILCVLLPTLALNALAADTASGASVSSYLLHNRYGYFAEDARGESIETDGAVAPTSGVSRPWADAGATADRIGGLLHSKSEAKWMDDWNTGDVVHASSHASWWQTVTLTNVRDDVREVDLQFALDGYRSDLRYTSANLTLTLGGDVSGYAGVSAGEGAAGATLARTLLVPPQSTITVKLAGYLDTYAYSNYWTRNNLSDFAHTAHFRWDLAEGVSYATTDGSRFAPESITPVPEPVSLAALGFGVVGAVRRRKVHRAG